LVYVDDVNTLGGSLRTVKKNTKSLVVATKEIGLEVNADKPKYMVMSRDHRAGRSHNLKNGNTYFESVQDFKYLGTTVKNKKYIHVEIKSGFKQGNASYHSVQNLLSSSLLSTNIKIKIHITIISPVVLYGCKILSLTLREGCRLRMFENRVLREYLDLRGTR
jgi:hypothetical protein